MYYVALYFLIGAIVAVWTAINQSRIEREDEGSEKLGRLGMISAYALIALAWPISVVAFVYSLFAGLVAGGEQGGD
jgi:hypothetical protein